LVFSDSEVFVILPAFYPIVLMISHKFSVHFHPFVVGCQGLLDAYSLFRGSSSTRYGGWESLVSQLTSVLAWPFRL
jgi:hypothetical protein